MAQGGPCALQTVAAEAGNLVEVGVRSGARHMKRRRVPIQLSAEGRDFLYLSGSKTSGFCYSDFDHARGCRICLTLEGLSGQVLSEHSANKRILRQLVQLDDLVQAREGPAPTARSYRAVRGRFLNRTGPHRTGPISDWLFAG